MKLGKGTGLTKFLVKYQAGRCYLCGEPMVTKRRRGWKKLVGLTSTRDHVFPRSLGHTATGNVLLAHERCNVLKGPRRPTACEILYVTAAHKAFSERAA